MTILYPDISGYDAGISLSGMAAVVVKATEGTTYTNPDYARVARDAASRGIPWAAYHFLHHNSSPSAQAQHYHQVAGNTPCMLDVETATDGTRATVGDALAFVQALAQLGGQVVLAYLPRWYWQALGSPDLRPLAAAGVGLVSSNYTTYSDTGPGWAPYGGVAPVVWQYTDAHQLNGFTVDMNAYRGTVDELHTLFAGGGDMLTPQDVQLIWAHPIGGPKHTQDAATQLSDLADQVVRGASSYDGGAYGPVHDTLTAVRTLSASVQALASAGTSVDTSAVLAAIAALKAEVDAIRAALAGVLAASASAEQAGATALAQS